MASERIGFEILRRVLRPTVRFFLRRSVTFQDFVKLAKVVFVDVARAEIETEGQKPNVSRISMLTGLNRLDVAKICRENEVPEERSENVLGQVLMRWCDDPSYRTKAGGPRVLSHEGEESEFHQLVRLVTKNYSPGTVLSELERLQVVERTVRGLRPLRATVWTGPAAGPGVEVLSEDLETLFLAIEQNIFTSPATPNLHIRTEYDNIFLRDIPKIRKWVAAQGKIFHQRVGEYLAKFDKDLAGGELEAGGKVSVTAFSLTSVPAETSAEKASGT